MRSCRLDASARKKKGMEKKNPARHSREFSGSKNAVVDGVAIN